MATAMVPRSKRSTWTLLLLILGALALTTAPLTVRADGLPTGEALVPAGVTLKPPEVFTAANGGNTPFCSDGCSYQLCQCKAWRWRNGVQVLVKFGCCGKCCKDGFTEGETDSFTVGEEMAPEEAF